MFLGTFIILLAAERLLNKKIMPEYRNPREGDIKHSLAFIKRARDDLNYTKIIDFENGLKCLLNYFF